MIAVTDNPVLRLAVAAAAGLALAACAESEAGEGAEGTAGTAVVSRQPLEIRAEAAGIIEPIRVVEVKSKASGEIINVLVETGDFVRRGELLVEVDPRDVRNAYSQADADLDVARARLATSEAQRKRAEELRSSGVVTEQEFEAAALDEANGRAQFVKARTSLELARERLGDVTIRAPLDGTIIQRTIEPGQIIASASGNVSGGTTLLLMADMAEMQVRTLVDETDIGRIVPGQIANVKVEAYPDRNFQGTVYKVEPRAVVEQNVTMFPVLVRLDNPDGLLKPGMNSEVQVEIARRDETLVVPNAAIVGLRDMAAAAEVLGLDAEKVRTALRGGMQGGMAAGSPEAGGASAAADGGTGPAEARRASGGTESPRAGPNGRSGRDAPRGSPAAARSPEAGADAEPAGTGADQEATVADAGLAACETLREKVRSQGRDALDDGDRARLRTCLAGARAGGERPGSGGARGAGGGAPAVVFVVGPSGPEPRMVTLGVNDWDHTEIVRGLEEGERVYLMSVARLQQQQQQMVERIRTRNNPFGGGAGGRR